jgi:O-antigen/teichoic acid export membrane protein
MKTACATPPKPFHNILRLSAGEFLSRTLNFLTLLYVARAMGVQGFGVLEFALAMTAYALKIADMGLEAWATREAAQTDDLDSLAARVLPLRFLLAAAAFLALLILLPFLPKTPEMRIVVVLSGLMLFTQAAGMKWAFLGKEQMTRVSVGNVLCQVVFTLAVIALVHGPARLVWIPVLRLAGDLVLVAYFWRHYVRDYGPLRARWTLAGARSILRSTFSIGASQALGLLNYNFDLILLGFLTSMSFVGIYSAAYKPVGIALACASVYMFGLFPALARSHAKGPTAFRELVSRSLRICAIVAIPVGITGSLLAGPLINFLFGRAYADGVAPLRVLIWSVSLLILRSSYHFGLRAAHHERLELHSAILSAVVNVGLNILLIPQYGMMGAAWSTVAGEAAWLFAAHYYFHREVAPLDPLPLLARPALAGAVMVAYLFFGEPLHWMLRAALSCVMYFAALWVLKERQIRWWVHLASACVSWQAPPEDPRSAWGSPASAPPSPTGAVPRGRL